MTCTKPDEASVVLHAVRQRILEVILIETQDTRLEIF